MTMRGAGKRLAGGGKEVLVGLDDVLRRLAKLEPNLAKKRVRTAMRQGLKLIQAEAKARAPVDTGRLRRAIKVRAAKRKKQTKGIVRINVQVGAGDFQGETFYAAIIEYGSSTRPPHPFMAPAFDSKGDEAMRATSKALVDAVEAEAASLGKAR